MPKLTKKQRTWNEKAKKINRTIAMKWAGKHPTWNDIKDA